MIRFYCGEHEIQKYMSDPFGRRGEEKQPGTSRRRWLQALGIAGTAGLAGCTGESSTDTPAGSETETDGDALGTATETSTRPEELPEVAGTYNSVISSPVDTLNPLYNTEYGAGNLIAYTLEMGYGFKPGNRQMPQLYELTTDEGKVWTATVRENLQFSEPYGQVTAEDFVYLVQELHQSDWAATANSDRWPAEVTVEQTGEFEFQIELPEANLLYPETYDPLLYPIPKALLEPYVAEQNAEGLQQDQELLNLEFTGNLGPYTLDEWNRSSGMTFTRNEDYYLREAADQNALFENAPYFEELEVKVVQEQASRLGALETGETDTAAVPPERVSRFDGLDNVDVKIIPQPYN